MGILRETQRLLHLSALQVGANRERAGVGLLYVGNRRIEIEIGNVAQDQAPGICVLRDAAHDVGQGLVGIVRADANRQMHDPQIRPSRIQEIADWCRFDPS